jgi:hypothetical protein
MGANSLTTVINNPAALRQTGSLRHEMYEDSGGAGGEAKAILDENGIVALFGRGDLDKNVTYIALYNTNNILHYAYINAGGNGWIVTTVKP